MLSFRSKINSQYKNDNNPLGVRGETYLKCISSMVSKLLTNQACEILPYAHILRNYFTLTGSSRFGVFVPYFQIQSNVIIVNYLEQNSIKTNAHMVKTLLELKHACLQFGLVSDYATQHFLEYEILPPLYKVCIEVFKWHGIRDNVGYRIQKKFSCVNQAFRTKYEGIR